MNLTERLTVPAQVMARQVGDETVILDLATGTYFGLDPVGARLWQLLGEDKTVADICETLFAEYEVSLEDLQRDVTSLLDELRARGLVSVAP